MYQFGHVGSALNSLRSALMVQRHHGLKSYALFVDLVREFDSIQHDVLYTILKKLWSPTLPHKCHR